jgi:hypothetical protein
MKQILIVGTVALLVMAMGVSMTMAQDVELPLTWKGYGEAEILIDGQFEETYFDVELHIDQEGWVEGEFVGNDGKAKLNRLFYSVQENGKRILMMVITAEIDYEKVLFILKGRMLKDQLYYGELLMKPYDEDGSIEKSLDLKYSIAEEIYETYMPSGLSKALQRLEPVGMFKIKGSY